MGGHDRCHRRARVRWRHGNRELTFDCDEPFANSDRFSYPYTAPDRGSAVRLWPEVNEKGDRRLW